MGGVRPRLWIPKVFVLLSPHNFYDNFVQIIESLVTRLQCQEGLDNLLEAAIYEIVVSIELPIQNQVLNYRGTMIEAAPSQYQNLPQMSPSFF